MPNKHGPGKARPIDEERGRVSRKWVQPLGHGSGWPISMRMASTPVPFCEMSTSQNPQLVCSLTENSVRPVGRINIVKEEDNNIFCLPLNFDK